MLSAVEAFSLSSELVTQLAKAASLMPEAFPYPRMGGEASHGQMKGICKVKGGTIAQSVVAQWARSKREPSTTAAVDALSPVL